MEPITDDTAEVSIDDLTMIRAALNSAYHQNTVIDLAEQYRKLSQRPSPSKLTLALQNALTLVAAYIELARAEDEPEEASDE